MKPAKMGPLISDHPLIRDGTLCQGCFKPFHAGDYVTLVVIGPGDSEEAREKAREGRAYSAVATPAHWACVTGEEG